LWLKTVAKHMSAGSIRPANENVIVITMLQ
jgi:hypothetical protein